MKIEAETTFNKFRVRINGVIQMSIERNIDTFQSWITDESYYAIEVQVKGSTALYEYDSREKWESIIKKMEEYNII